MSKVKINNKTYDVPELNFRHSKMMEQMGLPVEGMMNRRYIFSAVSAFTAIVAQCEPEIADNLVEQHIMGGGSLETIYEAFAKAINDSGFFRKLLHIDEQEKSTKKSPAQMDQKSSESYQ